MSLLSRRMRRAAGGLYVPATPGGIDANTVLYLPMDTARQFADISYAGSGSPHPETVNGNAAISTAVVDPWSGDTGWGLFDGAGDYIGFTTASTDLNLGSGSMTIEFQARPNASAQDDGIISTATNAFYGGWVVQIHGATAGVRKIVIWDTGATISVRSAEGSVVDGEAAHWAMVRSGNTGQWYKNGIASGAAVDLTGKTFNSQSNIFVVGRGYTGLDSYYWDGRLGHLRVSNIARDPAGFPPAAPYTL